MAAIKQKKSAYEEALDFVKSGASNLASGFKKSAQPVAQSASNFYSNFSKGLQNYGAQQDAQARQRQQQATNFAKNIVSFGSQAKNNLANNFAGNINAIKQIPQATRESIKIAPISIKKIIPTAKQGIGSFAVTASQAPARSTGIPLLDIANFATGGKLTPGAGTIGQKLPGLRPAGTQMAREGYQEQRVIDQQINEAVPQLDESRSLAEKIQDPRWVARGLTMNAPSFLTSVGLSAATGILTKNPALTTAVLFGSSQIQNAGDAYGDAIQNGATEEEAANLATFVGTVNGILDTIGIGKILERIPGGAQVKSSILKYALRNIIEGSLSEGSTESIQQMVQNAVARAYYDHKRDILAGVPESGFFGALMGGATSGIVDTANIGTGNIQQEEPVAAGVSPTAPQFRVNTGPMHPEDIAVASDAIKFLERSQQGGDIQDYMDPIYQKSVNDLKLLAGHYIGPQYAKNTPIETIAQEMKNRIEIDTGDIKNAQIEAGLDNNLAKNLTEKLQKPPEAQDPAVQAIESDIDQALTRDVGQTVVAQPSYDTTPASNEAFDMKKEDISGALKSVLSDQEIEILNPKGIIVTPDGQIAEGKYFDSMIAVVEEGGKVKSQTVYHEAFHALVDKVADKATYQAAIDEMRTGNKMSENEAVEKLAEDFPKFVKGEVVGGEAEMALFNGLINSVHKIRNAQNTAQLIAQSKPTQPVQIGITSAQAASPMTASIIEEGNKLFEAGQVDEGFAKLQEATDSTKGELESLLAEGNTQINRLETGTHGLYFGVPEPSFWLNITPENMDVALGKTAQFAKNHGQESFITAKHSFAGESLGVELKFKPNLTNQDIIAIEKIVNDSGMGFTVNQATGEAVAYNINQFDGMDQKAWLAAAHTAINALQSNGFITNAIFDNYDVGVYTKDTYDNLISRGDAQASSRGQSTTQGQGITPGNTPDTTGSAGNVPTQGSNQASGAKFSQVTSSPNQGSSIQPQGSGSSTNGILYHGTDANFNKFDLKHYGKTDDGFLGKGIYLTSDKEMAKTFGKNVVEVYADLKNPLVIEDPYAFGAVDPNRIKNILGISEGSSPEKIRKTLIDKGYDGVVVNTPYGEKNVEVMVINPDQIKTKPETFISTPSTGGEITSKKGIVQAGNTYADLHGVDPEQTITVYRGVKASQNSKLSGGEWVTQNRELARLYSRDRARASGEDAKIISQKVKAKDLIIDPSTNPGVDNEFRFQPSSEGEIEKGGLKENGPKFRQVTPPPVEGFVPTPPKETPGPGQKERGLVESIREEPTNIPDVRSGVSGAYDTTTDEGRIQYGQDAIKQDYQGSLNEVLADAVPLSNEVQGKGYALFQDLQKRAMEAKNAGKNDEYEFLKNQAIEVGNAMARKATPAAQALQFFHLWSQSSPESMVDWAKGIFEQANEIKNLSIGRGIRAATGLLTGNKSWKLTLTKEMEQHIRDKMADIYMIIDKDARAKATAELMKEVTKGIPTPAMTLIDAYRYQNALSGVRTHLRNLTSNTFNSTVVRPLVLLDMAAWDTVKGIFTGKKGEHSFKEIPVYYRSLFGSAKEAQNAFMDTWRDSGAVFGKGDQPLDENYASFNTLMQERVPGYLNVTGRALEGADKYFTTLIRNAEYARLLSQGVSESEAMARAKAIADYTLYRNQLDPKNKSGQGKILSGIDAITNFIMKGRNLPLVGPVMKLFVMFLRVPMAVAKMSLEFNPVTGPLTAIGAANKAEQFAKARIGASIMMMGMTAALAGRTTWEAPTDEEEKRKFYDSGRKPYSFLLDTPAGQIWVPFSYLGPFGIVFGTGAAAKHYFVDSKTALTDSNMQKAGKVLLSGLQQWSQQTPLSGVGGFVRTMQGDIDYKVVNNLSFSSGQFVPLNSLLGDVTHWIDPTFRKPHGYLEGLAKNIPGLSQNLDPITNSMGEPAKRNITDLVFPWSMGKATPEFEQQYKDVLSENQLTSEANYYKKQGEQELENALRGQGISVNKVSGGTGSAQQKGTEAKKKNVDTLLKAYEDATSEDVQQKIRSSLEQRYGVNFDEVYQNYLTKDTQIHQKGLSEGVEKKLERSKEFTYVRKIRDKFDGSGIGGDFLNETMQKHNITQDDLDYDDKTLLPDDVQLDEIKSMTEGLSGEPLFTLLVAMRRVSEGSRKALLTDGLVGDLADENIISDAQAKQLKRIIWDSGKGTYKLKPGGGLSKSDLTIKFDVPDIKKTGVSLGKGFSGGGNEKSSVSTPKTGFTKIKVPKAPGIQFQPTRSATSGIRLRTPIKTLSGLGGK